MNGPLGRLGTLLIPDGTDGQTTLIKNAILTNLEVEDSTAIGINYTLTFLVSLQC